MKTLKSFSTFIVLTILLSSCVVKSLNPFYTQDIIYFEQKFIGNWQDSEKTHWSIEPYKEVMLKESKKEVSEFDKDELKMYKSYKDGYVIIFEKDSITKSTFLAMPFKIKDQLFLDFTPIEDQESEQSKNNNLYTMHLIKTHTLAKFDITSDNEINIKWLSSKKLESLLDENKIKIEHEKVGFDETVLLTATSEELVKFIEKYMNSEDEDKWKTDVEVNLKRSDT
jgi:hypothetical protein